MDHRPEAIRLCCPLNGEARECNVCKPGWHRHVRDELWRPGQPWPDCDTHDLRLIDPRTLDELA